MFLGWSLPLPESRRGAGFGNEVIPWGKAFIAARELGLRTLHPAWALNSRGYRRDFGTSRLDWPLHQAIARAPGVTITRDMASKHDDYADVVRNLSLPRGKIVVRHASGMAGGYAGIWRAREYLRSQVAKPPHVATDLYRIRDRLRRNALTVAMHVRSDGFTVAPEGPRPGEFNRTLPIEWYHAIAEYLRAHFREHLQLIIVADDPERDEVQRLQDRFGTVQPPARARPLLSDILLMSSADLLVCSVSSLSLFGAFISERPYVWYGPHLNDWGGWRSIWGHEREQHQGGLTARNQVSADPVEALLTRGVAVGMDGALPEPMMAHLSEVLQLKNRRYDLIEYGLIPTMPARPGHTTAAAERKI